MKRSISLLFVISLVLIACAVFPLSASAQVADEVVAATAEPSQDDTEDYAADYPVITSLQNQSNGTKITWNNYEDNINYRIYYRKAAVYSGTWDDKYAGGGWNRLATVKGNSYVHASVTDGEIGIYTVRCVDSSGSFTSDFYEQGWENTFYAPPVINSIRFDEDGVRLTWDPAWLKHGERNGECCRVYRKTAGSSWTRIADGLTEGSFFDATAAPGTTYTYTIRLVSEDGTRFLSDHNGGKGISFDAYPLVTSIENTSKGTKLSWLSYSGAAKYRVYCLSSGTWKRIGQVSGTNFVDESVKNGESRTYTVRALNAKDSFISDYKREGWTNIYFAPPQIMSIGSTTEGVKLTWEREDKAEDYRIYRKTTGGWIRLAQTDGSEYTDTTAVSGTRYTYTIRMVSRDDGRFMSDYLSGKSCTYVAAPAVTGVTNTATGAKITWSASAGAKVYRVYYLADTGWTRIAAVSGTEYLDDAVNDGETREYTVRCLDANGNFVSDYYRNGYINTFYAPPRINKLEVQNKGITISWNRSPGAEDYRVYRRTENETWTRIAQTDENSFTDATAIKGVKYLYTLRMVTADGDRFMSDFLSGSSIIACETPAIGSAQITGTGVLLTWDAVENAYSYPVYRYSDDESRWVRLANVHGTSYIDKEIAHNENRIYTVRCLNEQGYFCSDFMHTGVAQTYYAPPKLISVTDSLGMYTIRWDEQPDTVSCSIYRKRPGEYEYALAGDRIQGESYLDTDVIPEGIYSYAIQAHYPDGHDSGVVSDEIYYRNGTPLNGSVIYKDTTYLFIDGKLASGFFRENGKQYYYDNGVRIEESWYKNRVYAKVYTPAQWLYALMETSGDIPSVDPSNDAAVFDLALERGIISSYSNSMITKPVTRRFAAQTIVNALGYQKRTVDTISDLKASDTELYTAVYYGYFLPDNSNRVYPDNAVTAAEFDSLLSDLRLYQLLHGKTVLGFGDSIMQGVGNHDQGITEMIGEKYGMYFYDYAANGSVMGIAEVGRGHIATHIRKAITANLQADIILINGGTNDMLHTELGNMTDGYDLSDTPETTYSEGFEKAMWLITNNWKSTPVIYIRAHNMNLGSDKNEKLYGNRGLKIAEKWNAAAVDMYNDSDLNTENSKISDRYTYWENPAFVGRSDSIHPVALGYASYYLPAISEKLAQLFDI